jgi:hypothetical protein
LFYENIVGWVLDFDSIIWEVEYEMKKEIALRGYFNPMPGHHWLFAHTAYKMIKCYYEGIYV